MDDSLDVVVVVLDARDELVELVETEVVEVVDVGVVEVGVLVVDVVDVVVGVSDVVVEVVVAGVEVVDVVDACEDVVEAASLALAAPLCPCRCLFIISLLALPTMFASILNAWAVEKADSATTTSWIIRDECIMKCFAVGYLG